MQQERIRRGENLVFTNVQEANDFRESVEAGRPNKERPSISRDREVVADALAKKFEEHGHGVSSLHVPWEHTPAEHGEVQDLVDIAFTRDLQTALRQAEQSDSFPRNIDLLHDVLTGELYDAMRAGRLNTVRLSGLAFIAIVVPVLLVVTAIFFFVYSL